MEFNESHLKYLKEILQYDEGMIEEVYDRLIFEKYEFEDIGSLRVEIEKQLKKTINQKEIDIEQFFMKKNMLEKRYIKRTAREVYSFVFQGRWLCRRWRSIWVLLQTWR